MICGSYASAPLLLAHFTFSYIFTNAPLLLVFTAVSVIKCDLINFNFKKLCLIFFFSLTRQPFVAMHTLEALDITKHNCFSCMTRTNQLITYKLVFENFSAKKEKYV